MFQAGDRMCKGPSAKMSRTVCGQGLMIEVLVGHDKEFGFYFQCEGKPTEEH